MANNNLFYQLYSHENNYVDVGYTCDSALDESQTSFDISDDKGVISDSNGDPLASIDLSDIHINPVTNYSSDTKVLNPGGNYILHGPENGDSYGNQEFIIPENPNARDPNSNISNAPNWPLYTDVDFDLTYNGIPVHVDTSKYPRDPENPKNVTNILQKIFDCLQIPLVASIVDSSCASKNCNCECDDNDVHKALKIQSEKLGFPFSIENFKISPILIDEANINSPFNVPEVELEDVETIVNAYEDIKALLEGDENYSIADFYQFVYDNQLDGFKNITKEEPENYIAYSYFKNILTNEYLISAKRLQEFWHDLALCKGFNDEGEYVAHHYEMKEMQCNRVGSKKYPNGAMQGLIIVPQYPDGIDESYLKSLKLVYLKDNVNVYSLIDCSCGGNHYVKESLEVSTSNNGSNVSVVEFDCSTYCKGKCNSGSCEEILRCVTEKENTKQEEKKKMNLQKFLDYATKNDLWIKFGPLFAIISNADDENNDEKNLIPSVFINNPNNIPIKVNFMIFA